MADLNTNIPQIASGQAQKEVRMNALTDAASPAMLYGRDADNCSGLEWAYLGGRFESDPIANDTVTLTNNATNYLVAARADGAVSVSTSATNWDDSDDYIRLYKITTSAGIVTDYEDHRQSIGATGGGGGGTTPYSFTVAASDETTALTTGSAKLTFRMAVAMTLSAIRASLTVAQASGSIFTVDVNEAGSSILSTKLTVDNTEKTSVTAATPPVISDSALADDAEITIDIDQVGDGTAKGLKVTFIGTI